MASYGHVSCFHCRWLVCNTPFFGLVCVTLFECHHVFPKLSLFFDKMSHTCSGFPVPSRESGLYQVHIALFPVTARNCLNFCRPKIGGKNQTPVFMVVRLCWLLNWTLLGMACSLGESVFRFCCLLCTRPYVVFLRVVLGSVVWDCRSLSLVWLWLLTQVP